MRLFEPPQFVEAERRELLLLLPDRRPFPARDAPVDRLFDMWTSPALLAYLDGLTGSYEKALGDLGALKK